MIKKIITILSILTLAQSCFAVVDESKIIAKVNGKSIYEADIQSKIDKFMEVNQGAEGMPSYDKLEPSAKEEIIKSIILGDLISQEAKKAKTDESLEYKQALEFAENQFMQKIYLENLIKAAVTEDKIQKKYKQITLEYKDRYEYKASHILVSTEEEAKAIKKRLDNGEKFVDLAKEFSKDSNKEDGGSLGYFSEGQMVEPFEKAVVGMKIGAVSAPIKTDFGYHIITLEDKRKATVPSLAELKTKIIEELTGQFIQEYITKLKSENKVEFF
jgi:peptidyl-prolyl cis-trans isomerase C